jgi:hypothetical protein
MGMGGPIGTGTMFPPLLIPINKNPAKALVQQTAGPDPKKMTAAPGVFHRPGPGALKVGVAVNNPTVWQVQTNLEFFGPGTFDHIPGGPVNNNAVFFAGGRTGGAVTVFPGTPATSKATYTKTAAQFGGPSSTRVAPATPIRVWAHGPQALPCKHPAFMGADAGCASQLLAAYPGTQAAAGGTAGNTTATPGGPAPMSPNVVVVSIPNVTGKIALSASAVKSGTVTNMATSVGFPWTTGMITLSAPAALLGKEKFIVTGMDTRMGGVGTISLVSGALSARAASGANANRSWARYTLPEPAAILGAAGALAVLGVCHGIVRRRSR